MAAGAAGFSGHCCTTALPVWPSMRNARLQAAASELVWHSCPARHMLQGIDMFGAWYAARKEGKLVEGVDFEETDRKRYTDQ